MALCIFHSVIYLTPSTPVHSKKQNIEVYNRITYMAADQLEIQDIGIVKHLQIKWENTQTKVTKWKLDVVGIKPGTF